MNKKHVVVVGNEILKLSLFSKELDNIENVEVTVAAMPELKLLFNQESIDLLLLDYSNLKECYLQDIYLECLGLDILVYCVPEEALQDDFIKWKCLKGVLMDTSPVEHLCKSVRHILHGGMWIPRRCLERMVNYYRSPNVSNHITHVELTKRERQILTHLANGQTNQQIANTLFLAESTVKTHIYKMYKKMNVHSRHDAIEQVRLLNG